MISTRDIVWAVPGYKGHRCEKAMAKRVTMTTVPVGATVMQVYKVIGVRTSADLDIMAETV